MHQVDSRQFFQRALKERMKNISYQNPPINESHYITINRDSTLQTNACSYMRVKQQTALGPAALGLGRGLQPRVMSNPATNRGLYFINLLDMKVFSFEVAGLKLDIRAVQNGESDN